MEDDKKADRLTTSGTSPPDREEPRDVFAEEQELTNVEPRPPVETTSREKTRSRITFILIWTFTATIAVAMAAPILAAVLSSFDKEFFSELIRTIYPPLIALVGSATGFYFGSQNK